MTSAPNPRGAQAERRRANRQTIARPAVFTANAPGDLLRRGTAVDISLNGLRIQTRNPAPVGTHLEIELHPPHVGDAGVHVVLVRGDVVRLECTDADHATMGVRLVAGPGPPRTDVVADATPEDMRALLGQVTDSMRARSPLEPSPLAALETLRDTLPVDVVFRPEIQTLGDESAKPRKRHAHWLALAILLILFATLLGLLFPLWKGLGTPARLVTLPAAPPMEQPLLPENPANGLAVPAPEILLGQAQELLAIGQVGMAREQFAMLAQHPAARPLESFLGRLGEAQALLAQNRRADAQAAVAKALANNPGSIPPAWHRAAESLHAALAQSPPSTPGAPTDSLPEALPDSLPEAPTSAQEAPASALQPTSPAGEATPPPPPPLPRENPGNPVTDEFGLTPREASSGTGGLPPADIPMEGIALVVSREDYLMAMYVDGALAQTFPVGLGRGGSTPTGRFAIANKIRNPDWYNRGDVVPAGDPRNPLGNAWMGLGQGGEATSYGIHPTTESASIGANESRGCVRMRPGDADLLFQLCPLGTPVIIRP
jgi:hypothetical protein